MKRVLRMTVVLLIVLAIASGSLFWTLKNAQWGYARTVSDEEKALRSKLLEAAEAWLGCNEADGSHETIIDVYNSFSPLPQGYTVQYSDNWCAAFASAAAIQSELTDIIPVECGCERQIGLWQDLGRWEEDDNYTPLPGDYIYYSWDEGLSLGDNTGWADHVGIVVGTVGPFIRVIEGNKDDSVCYRTILVGDYRIRGYGLPDYASLIS